MTVNDILAAVEGRVICGDTDKETDGVYVGDLLSRAMSHVTDGCLWVTIMTNVNVVAVATLTEPAAIILAEGVTLQDDAVESADENGITVISSPLPAYEICVRLHESGQGRGA